MTANKSTKPNHQTFSQRYGYDPLPEPMKLEELSDDLRREVYNEVRNHLLTLYNSLDDTYDRFVERVLGKFDRKPEDEVLPSDKNRYQYSDNVNRYIKSILTTKEFYHTLNFIEIVVNDRIVESNFTKHIEQLFDKYSAAYWLNTSEKPYVFIPHTLKEQGIAVKKSFQTVHEGGMEGAFTHLRQAAKQINAQEYAKAIVDSIHAVESVARLIDPKASSSLGPALESLEKADLLRHPALKSALKKLYGYTSDEQGIRHALLDKGAPDVGLDEAMFMFGACASFAAYLVSKHQKSERIEDENK